MTISKANLNKSSNAVIDYSRARCAVEKVKGQAEETLAATIEKLVTAKFPLAALGSAKEAADNGATLEHDAINAAIVRGFPDEERGAQFLLAADPAALSDKEKSDCKPGTKTEDRSGNDGKGSRRYWGAQKGSVRGAMYRAYAKALGIEKPKAEAESAESEATGEADSAESGKSVFSRKLQTLVELRNWVSDKGLDEGLKSIAAQKSAIEGLEKAIAAFGINPERI
jgi:hypothetical protein